MALSISKFFESLGCPLKNQRWSWGARSGHTLILRTWSDEYSVAAKSVVVLRSPDGYKSAESYGLDERIGHAQALWNGGLAGYTVIANAKSATEHPRKISNFRDDAVFSIARLEARDDGSVVAIVGGNIAIGDFHAHQAIHRTATAVGTFPVDESLRTGFSTSTYKEKLPAMRA